MTIVMRLKYKIQHTCPMRHANALSHSILPPPFWQKAFKIPPNHNFHEAQPTLMAACANPAYTYINIYKGTRTKPPIPIKNHKIKLYENKNTGLNQKV